jgi:hypothetical protein
MDDSLLACVCLGEHLQGARDYQYQLVQSSRKPRLTRRFHSSLLRQEGSRGCQLNY